MGRAEVYDRADVNDITQILNQAARFQHSGSSALALRLENLTWTSAAEHTHLVPCCSAVAEQAGLAESGGSDARPAARSVTPFGYLKSGHSLPCSSRLWTQKVFFQQALLRWRVCTHNDFASKLKDLQGWNTYVVVCGGFVGG